VGNIQTRSDRDGYIARWRDSDNRRRSKSFRTKGEAQRFLVQIEAAKVQGDYIDPHRSKMTVETWAAEFRRLRARRRPGTIEWEDAALRTHVLPAFAKRSMGSIRRTDIQEFVDRLAGTYAPSTVARHYGFLHVFFQEAMDLDVPVINRNPCRKIVLPDEEEREQRFFTPEEVRQLYDAFAPRYKPMVLVGCYAGLRIGEQAGLRASDILFGHGEIFVRQGAFEPLAGPVEIGPLKTKYSRGRVDVPQFLLDELARYIKEHPPATEGPAAGLLFPSAEGEPLRPRNWRRRYWDPAVKAAGIEPATSHAMRHTFVSFLRPGAVGGEGRRAGPAPGPRIHLAGLPAPVRTAGRRRPLGRCCGPRKRMGEGTVSSPVGGTTGGQTVSTGRSRPYIVGAICPVTCTFLLWALLGSNQRPLPCKGSALPLS